MEVRDKNLIKSIKINPNTIFFGILTVNIQHCAHTYLSSVLRGIIFEYVNNNG